MKMYSNLPIGLHDITEAKKRLTNHIYKTAQLPSSREFNFEVRHSPMPPDGTLRIP